jgi:hypothetical protein
MSLARPSLQAERPSSGSGDVFLLMLNIEPGPRKVGSIAWIPTLVRLNWWHLPDAQPQEECVPLGLALTFIHCVFDDTAIRYEWFFENSRHQTSRKSRVVQQGYGIQGRSPQARDTR